MGQTSRPDPEKSLEFFKLLSFQLLNDAKEEICKFPVAVKNLTTAGVILEILHLDEDLKTDNFKGCEGVLQIIAQDDHTLVEVPGKILWTRNREGDPGVTLGVEWLEPLSMPLRQALEADMAIGAKDMKVLWDYWDEIQESTRAVELADAVKPASPPTDQRVTSDSPTNQRVTSGERADTRNQGGWGYWLGFGAILSGLAMQFQQSEYLGFFGLLLMFSGSSVVAMKSLISMRQLSSPGSAD